MAWRIKTKEELGDPCFQNWNHSMDYLFGLPITNEEAKKIIEFDEGLAKNWFPEKNPGTDTWFLQKKHIIEVSDYSGFPLSEKPYEFQVGDLVTSISRPGDTDQDTVFKIINISNRTIIIHNNTITCGWDGTDRDFSIKPDTKRGCWSVSSYYLTLVQKSQLQSHSQSKIQNNEVSRSHLPGEPRGNVSTIYCEKIQIASGSRFVGRRATDFKPSTRSNSGIVQYNFVQPN